MHTPREPRTTRTRRPGRWMGLVVGLMLLLTALNRLTVPSVAADGNAAMIDQVQHFLEACVANGGQPDADYDDDYVVMVTCHFPNGVTYTCTFYSAIGAAPDCRLEFTDLPGGQGSGVPPLTRPPQPHGGTQVQGIGAVITSTTAPPTPPSSVVPPGTSSGLSQQPVVAATPSPSATSMTGTPSTGQRDGSAGSGTANLGLTGPVATPTGQGSSAVGGVITESATPAQPSIPSPTPTPGPELVQGELTSRTSSAQAAVPSALPSATPPA